jgi:hypothetical protein
MRKGLTATMPICIEADDDDFDENDDDFIQQQILLWNQAKAPPTVAAAASAAAATVTTGGFVDRKLERRELESLSRQLIRSDVRPTRKEQERQDALLAEQLAVQQSQAWLNRKPTAQELQDALYAQQLASHLSEMPEEDELIAIQIATEYSNSDRKRRLEEEESLGLAYAMQVQEQLEEETAVLQGKEEARHILDARTELRAFQYVEAKARKMHEIALPKLKARVQALGFSDESLDQCLEYIREDAPITIHLTEECLANLVKDTHYRSRFETNTSGGSRNKAKREQWEHSLFDGAYDDCPPFQRPKYGCLNLSGDIAGVVPARTYGKLVLTLASHLRYRCTFSDEDTGNKISVRMSTTTTTTPDGGDGGGDRDFDSNTSLATHNYYAHILMQYPDQDLVATLSVSRIRGAPSRCQKYKEVQIHGPICLLTDIQSLSVPGRYRTSTDELRQVVLAFQEQTRCNILWQEDLLHAEDDETA